MKLGFLLCLISFLGCIQIKPPQLVFREQVNKNIVILVDQTLEIYQKIIIGIRVASGHAHNVIQVFDDGIHQSALLKTLMTHKPEGIISLGPRSAHALGQSRMFLPSVFAMVPRLENYEFQNSFSYGVYMGPDLKTKLGLIKKIIPKNQTLLVLHSRHHTKNFAQKLEEYSGERFSILPVEIQSESDVMPALERHKHDFDSFLMIPEPYLLDIHVIGDLVDYLARNKKLFFALDCSMSKMGAHLAFGVDYYKLGFQLFNLVQKAHTAGMKPTKIISPDSFTLCINKSALENLENSVQIFSQIIDYSADKKISIKVFP